MPEIKPRPKLTKSAIDKIIPPASGYKIHWCGALRGFGARATPDGRITYVAQGRIHGKEARIPIGGARGLHRRSGPRPRSRPASRHVKGD